MKICYNETMNDSDLEKDLELCEKYGYEYIELRISYVRDYLKRHSMQELKNFFSSHRIKPRAFNSVEDVNFCTGEQWDYVLENFTYACRVGAKLGCRDIVTVPTTREEMKLKSEEETLEDSVCVLRRLSDIAEPYKSRIAFEPIGNRRWCVHSIRQAAEIIRRVDRENVGLTIDAFNIYANDGLADIEDLRLIPEGKIFVFHINDAMNLPVRRLEPAKHRLYPGDGKIPLRELCGVLFEQGYDDVASLELFGPWLEDVDAETVIKTGHEKIRSVLGLKKEGQK